MSMSRRRILKASSAGAVLAALEPRLGSAAVETETMPALFVSHGTPMLAVWDNDYTRGWAELGASLPRPKAILSISAHWITQGGVYLTGNPDPRVIYDMRGFPPELYEVEYEAVGDLALARELAGRITTTPALTNDQWGYDHGTWVVLKHMYPHADIPVIQLSINYAMAPERHFALGRELAFLRERGVLILGSGQFVHNLRMMGSRTEEVEPYPWAVEFSETVGGWVDQRDFGKVVDFQTLGPLAQLAHPTYDHFLPLLSVLGAASGADELRWINRGIMSGSMDMRCLVVTPA